MGDTGLIPGLGRPPGEGNGNLLQYCCLENPMDGGAWWATVCGVTKSWMQLLVTQLHPTLCDPTDCSLVGYSLWGHKELDATE